LTSLSLVFKNIPMLPCERRVIYRTVWLLQSLNWQTAQKTDRQTYRRTDRQTEKRTDGQADGQTYRPLMLYASGSSEKLQV